MKSRRILALLLAMVMVLGLGTMAMAAAPNDKVQINNMMVDASKVDLASFGLSAEEESTPVETFAATATYTDLDTKRTYPPIKQIEIQGFREDEIESSVGLKQGITYTLTLPAGTTASQLSNKTVTFKLGGTTTTPEDSPIYISYNGTTKRAKAGESISFTMTLTPNASDVFEISWTIKNTDGTTTYTTKSCVLSIYVPASTTDVSLSRLTIGGTQATISSSTVGGVTRYTCTAALEYTEDLDLANITVVATLGSSSANATMNSVSGVRSGNDVITFEDMDLLSAKELVVTNGPESNRTQYSRTYQVSAYVTGQTITVYVAFRGYLADQWFKGEKVYYDYGANGYGDGSSITDAGERNTISSAIATMLALKGENAPDDIDEATGRAIFEEASYIPVTLTVTDHSSESNRLPGMTVYDALDQAIKDYNSNKNGINPDSHTIAQTGAENNYISSMTFDSYEIGEFDCGYASGWMYTARTSIDDVTSTLPNAGLRYWPISSGMYIDWYYTAAYGKDFGYSMFDI